MVAFSINFPEVLEFYTCKEINGGNPEGISEIFNVKDGKVYVYLKLGTVDTELDINWEWIKPSGEKYFVYTQNIPSPSLDGYDEWENYICWGYLSLENFSEELNYEMADNTWEIRVVLNNKVISSKRFTIEKDIKRGKVEFHELLGENLENVYFKYPSSWEFYYDEEDDGYCQVYHFDENDNYILFAIFLSYDDILEDSDIQQNKIRSYKKTIAYTETETIDTRLYDEEDDLWYRYSISKFNLIYSTSGRTIFIISSAPEDVYYEYIDEFNLILDNLELYLFLK